MVLGELWWCMHVSDAVVSDRLGEHRTLPPSPPRPALAPMADGLPSPPSGRWSLRPCAPLSCLSALLTGTLASSRRASTFPCPTARLGSSRPASSLSPPPAALFRLRPPLPAAVPPRSVCRSVHVRAPLQPPSALWPPMAAGCRRRAASAAAQWPRAPRLRCSAFRAAPRPAPHAPAAGPPRHIGRVSYVGRA